MRRLLSFLMVLAAAVLGGCATPNIARDFDLAKARGSGVASGTITYQGGYAAYRLVLRSLASGETYTVEHGDAQVLNPVLAFKGEAVNARLGVRGSAFAEELPAGRYEIRSWHVSQGMVSIWSTGPIGVEFEIQPGRAVYLGNYHFRQTARMGLAMTDCVVALSDRADRDLPVLAAEFEALGAVPFASALQAGTRVEPLGGASGMRMQMPVVFVPVGR